MSKISDIELLIKDIIRVNESIVTTYDSELLCSDYKNTKEKLKGLYGTKLELINNLERSMNEFFQIKENFITRKIKLASFKLIPKITSFEYKFNLPQFVNTSSREYFCYICLMDKLTREYDVITLKNDGYYILDITATLNLKKLFEGD